MPRQKLTLKHPPKQGQPIDEVVERICSNCRFWDSKSNECRRRPPAINWQDGGEACWPMTAATHWCGEFKRSPVEHG